MELLSNLNSHGTTIIVVTHDIKIAEYANTNIVLRDGEIVGTSE
jgi:ABC-type lipoprotein export system ATPase subunit